MGKVKQTVTSIVLVVIGYSVAGPVFGTLYLGAIFATVMASKAGSPAAAAYMATLGLTFLLFIPGCFMVGFIPTIAAGIVIPLIAALGAS